MSLPPLNPFYGNSEAKLPKPHFFPENDRKRANDELQATYTVKVKPDLQPLYGYLVGRRRFVQLDELSTGDGIVLERF
jgi:hypothetical protein